jgi:outer membrane immunogenic protein
MRDVPLAAMALGGLAIVSSPAFAADLALKSPSLLAPYDWTGFYGGADLGAGVGRTTDVASAPPGTPFSNTTAPWNGTQAGLFGGYNWQAGWSVVGVETDIQWANFINNSTTSNPAGTMTLNDVQTLNWYGTTRARFGVAPSPGWLIYATGGVAYGSIRSDETVTNIAAAIAGQSSFNTTRIGWTAGAGVEAALTTLPTGVWSARLEFLYMDFGTFNYTFATVGPSSPMTISIHPTDYIVRVGLDYRFAPLSAPLVAKD